LADGGPYLASSKPRDGFEAINGRCEALDCTIDVLDFVQPEQAQSKSLCWGAQSKLKYAKDNRHSAKKNHRRHGQYEPSSYIMQAA